MKRYGKQDKEANISLPLPTPSDLRGRQSVRATFKLTEKSIDAISIVATHLGIKQKSLFDHLVDDIQSLNVIAREIQPELFNKQNRIQKTFVLSRKTLSALDNASKSLNSSRDALVEYLIHRLLPVIAEEREKHRKRKEILVEISEYLKQGEKILKKYKKILDEDDPIYEQFENAMTVSNNIYANMKSFVEKGEIIEEF